MNSLFSVEPESESGLVVVAWENTRERLAGELKEGSYKRHIEPLRLAGFEGGVVTIHAPGKFIYEWVQNKYVSTIEDYISDELGRPVRVLLRMVAEAKVLEDRVATSVSQTTLRPATHGWRPNPRLTFENYIVGDSNRLAATGAQRVASGDGSAFNPLFLYGPTGVGKTHLMHAIANQILSVRADARIGYMSGQEFMEDFVASLAKSDVESFRRRLRSMDMWMLDDIQFVVGRNKTQEEVFITYNHLYSLGRPIVVASDKAPAELFIVDDRLRSRFQQGLVADISMPDTPTRMAIILSKANQDGVELSTEIAEYLAKAVPGNIRVLEGAIVRVITEASIRKIPLTCALAEEIVDAHYRQQLKRPSPTDILQAVAEHFHIPSEDILSQSRKAPIVHARFAAIYLMREINNDSWKQIGSHLGNRDHTSIIHGYEKIVQQMADNKDLRMTLQGLRRLIDPNR